MTKEKKIFVLDTSVIIYDHNAIKSFKEHDVVVPITVLEELDNFKKGNDTKNYAAREFTRYIDKISGRNTLQDWVNINGKGHGMFMIEMHQSPKLDAEKIFGERKADHRILNSALYLSEKYPSRKVVLVTKDINLRIKAKSLSLQAEDYETGKIKNLDELYTGNTIVEKTPPASVSELYEKEVTAVPPVLKKQTQVANHFYILKSGQKSVLAWYNANTELLERVRNGIRDGAALGRAEIQVPTRTRRHHRIDYSRFVARAVELSQDKSIEWRKIHRRMDERRHHRLAACLEARERTRDRQRHGAARGRASAL